MKIEYNNILHEFSLCQIIQMIAGEDRCVVICKIVKLCSRKRKIENESVTRRTIYIYADVLLRYYKRLFFNMIWCVFKCS